MIDVQVKERPILFSGAMVRALLAGTKTQTRRIIKPQPTEEEKHPDCFRFNGPLVSKEGPFGILAHCPYGRPGERLWVRENMIKNLNTGTYWPMADGYTRSISEATGKPLPHEKSVPSIHMPRAASRLLLEITAVRCERLHDITNEDAIAEGCATDAWHSMDWKHPHAIAPTSADSVTIPVSNYASLWQEINGPDSWAANPWVWVVEFKVIQPSNG
jgi:hypothetical protein